MYWLFLLLSLGSMAIALRTTSMALMVVCLLAALGLLIAWAMGWYSAKLGSQHSRGIADPAKLNGLRQQAQARSATPQSGTGLDDPHDGA